MKLSATSSQPGFRPLPSVHLVDRCQPTGSPGPGQVPQALHMVTLRSMRVPCCCVGLCSCPCSQGARESVSADRKHATGCRERPQPAWRGPASPFSSKSFHQDRRSLPSGLITLQGPLSMPASPVAAAFATTRLGTPTLGRGGRQGGEGCRMRGRGRLSVPFLSSGFPRLGSFLGIFSPLFYSVLFKRAHMKLPLVGSPLSRMHLALLDLTVLDLS